MVLSDDGNCGAAVESDPDTAITTVSQLVCVTPLLVDLTTG